MKTRGVAVKEFKEEARSWTRDETRSKERDMAEQLFRLKFQLAGGQTDALKKIRELKKDLARLKTIQQERQGEPDDAPQAARGKKR